MDQVKASEAIYRILGTTTIYLEYENEDVEVTSSYALRVLIETRIEYGGL